MEEREKRKARKKNEKRVSFPPNLHFWVRHCNKENEIMQWYDVTGAGSLRAMKLLIVINQSFKKIYRFVEHSVIALVNLKQI